MDVGGSQCPGVSTSGSTSLSKTRLAVWSSQARSELGEVVRPWPFLLSPLSGKFCSKATRWLGGDFTGPVSPFGMILSLSSCPFFHSQAVSCPLSPLARTPSQQVPLEAPASTVPGDMVGPGNSRPAHTWLLPSRPGIFSRSRILEQGRPPAGKSHLHVRNSPRGTWRRAACPALCPMLGVGQWDQHLCISRGRQH